MSFLDRVAVAVMPAASDEDRAEARSHVESLAEREDWVRMIVDQHKTIEICFAEARAAGDPGSRQAAVRRLESELTAHSMAEEAVVYPALSGHAGKTQAGMAYE
jgi:hemerythrin superfamily protein